MDEVKDTDKSSVKANFYLLLPNGSIPQDNIFPIWISVNVQQSAGCAQAVLRRELRERYSFMAFEIGAKGGTVHARFGGDIIRRNRVNAVCHDVWATGAGWNMRLKDKQDDFFLGICRFGLKMRRLLYFLSIVKTIGGFFLILRIVSDDSKTETFSPAFLCKSEEWNCKLSG